MAQGVYADDGSLRTTIANTEGDTISLTVDTTGLSTETTLAAINTAIGTKADAAWSGTGNGSVIAILKAIALNTTPS